MKPFWRQKELLQSEQGLLTAVLAAHRASAFRDNISAVTAVNCFAGSSDLTKAIAASLLTLGGAHGPIEETMKFLRRDLYGFDYEQSLDRGNKIPGWGNSFIKGRKDDLWLEVDQLLEQQFTLYHKRLEFITTSLHRCGKVVYPNPSAYTAAAAIVLEIPAPLAPWLFIAGRLDGWTERIQKHFYGVAA